jgi:hypothetical protein
MGGWSLYFYKRESHHPSDLEFEFPVPAPLAFTAEPLHTNFRVEVNLRATTLILDAA